VKVSQHEEDPGCVGGYQEIPSKPLTLAIANIPYARCRGQGKSRPREEKQPSIVVKRGHEIPASQGLHRASRPASRTVKPCHFIERTGQPHKPDHQTQEDGGGPVKEIFPF